VTLINDPNARILCPQSFSPQAREHAEQVALLNRMYGVMEHDDDTLEAPADQERIYRAAEGDGDWMRLYHEDKGTIFQGRMYTIKAGYYRCQVCGFVLPVSFIRL